MNTDYIEGKSVFIRVDPYTKVKDYRVNLLGYRSAMLMFKQDSVVIPQRRLGDEQRKPILTKKQETLFPPTMLRALWGQENQVDNTAATGLFPMKSAQPEPALGPVDGMLQHAIQDATQPCDLPLRWEALAWLWVCCPDVADQLHLPWPEAPDLSQKAADYLERFATF